MWSICTDQGESQSGPKVHTNKGYEARRETILGHLGPLYAINVSGKSNLLRIVDDHTRMTWNAMLAKKSGSSIAPPLEDLLIKNAAAGKPCKYIRCDNAGENVKHKNTISSWR